MSFFTALKVALGALLVHKTRALLTSLGIVIGISTVIAMVSAGEGARRELDDQLDRVGRNLILINAGHKESGVITDVTPFTREDVDAIRKEAGPLLLAIAPAQITQRLVVSRSASYPTTIVGSTPELQRVRHWQLESGRFFSDEDVNQSAAVCVLGHTACQKLFPDRPNPIGETVRIERLNLRVLGVAAAKGHSPTGADQDDQIFMPLTTLQHKLVGEDRILLLVASANPDNVDAAREAITRVLRQRHHLKPGAAEDFEVSSVREMAELGDTVASTLQGLVAIIASISLVVGGIGIMNIMLVSVTERTREIGVRMSLGATPSDILTQFLLEAVVLALLGGTVGIALGIGGAAILAAWIGWPLVVSPTLVLITVLISAGVGVFFGYYPAWKASRLDPIEALHAG